MRHIFHFKLFTVATAIIIFSTITTGILTTTYLQEKQSALGVSLMQSTHRMLNQTLERIEEIILSTDKKLYGYIDVKTLDEVLNKLEKMPRPNKKYIKQIYLVDYSGRVIYPSSGKEALSLFFRRKVFPQVQLSRIALKHVHHLHTTIDFRYYLFSLLKFRPENSYSVYILVLEYNLDHPENYFLPFFRDLEKTYHVCVRDYENNVIYGVPFQLNGKYFAEQRFPSTFYRWLLQLEPRNVNQIKREERNRRFMNLVMVVINLILILTAWFLVYMSRREEIKLTRQKEEFISNVSHELKTPLSLIKMYSELLLIGRSRGKEKQREYLKVIFSETERMTFLINNILDFSNLEKGLQKFCFEEIDLSKTIKEYIEAFDYRFKKENVEIKVEIDDEIPTIFGDSNAIALIFMNLIDNAIKYTTSNIKKITIKLFQKDNRICLRVSDNGIGILHSEISRIFEKFYRSDNIAVRKVRGSGIGLSLVKYLIEAHRGEIKVESIPGEGSTFVILFPAHSSSH